jgi:hypothetical protein
LNILHVGNTAGVASTLAKYQKKLGHTARIIVKSKHPFAFDYEIPCKILSGMKYFLFANVVHYHSSPWISLIAGGRIRYPDYFLARAMNKSVVWHFHGSELRRQDARSLRFKELDSVAIVSTPDLLKHLPQAIWIPNPADPELFYPRKIAHSGTIVGCYDSYNPDVRSVLPIAETLNAVKELQRKGVDIKAKLLSGQRHHDVPRYFQEIDIWIDKFDMNFYGICAVEASLCEIPVVTQIGELESSFVPSCPFIITERQKIRESIEYLLSDEIRRELGRKGAEFAKSMTLSGQPRDALSFMSDEQVYMIVESVLRLETV